MNSKTVAYARSRLRAIGAFAALLAWGTALAEFGCNAWFWLFDRHDVLAAYLQSFADQLSHHAESLAIIEEGSEPAAIAPPKPPNIGR